MTEPIPLTWIVRSGVVIGLVIIAAIALAIGAHCRGSEPGAKSAASSPPAEPAARAEPATPEPAARMEPGGKPEPGNRPEPSAAAEPSGKPEPTGKVEPTGRPAPDDDKPSIRSEPARPAPAAPAKAVVPPKQPAGKGRPGTSAGSARRPGH